MTDGKALAGRSAIVTGGTRGIGLAIARLLAEDGASVVVSGRDAARVDAAAKEIETLGGAALGFLMTRAGAKVMMRQKSGRIVNMTSTAGAMGNAGQANYSAAKAGVIGLTKSTARELAHWNIQVNAVAPGLIETDMTAGISEEAREGLLRQVPLKRMGAAREVAEVVRFLAGDGAAYVTGQIIHVNGGLYM